MIYYSNGARELAKKNIQKCINSVATIPGSVLSYTDKSCIVSYLSKLYDLIEKEERSVTVKLKEEN